MSAVRDQRADPKARLVVLPQRRLSLPSPWRRCSLRRGRLSPLLQKELHMRITTRATVFALALLATAPLLAANSGTSMAGTDALKQETQTATAQDDCWQPALRSTDLSDGQAGPLPKPDSTPPDTSEVARHLHKAASCVRPLGLWNEGVSPKLSSSAIAMPAGTGLALLGQASLSEGPRGPDDLSAIPAKAANHF